MELISAEQQIELTRASRGRVVGFTGSRYYPILDDNWATGVGRVLSALSGASGFVTGACVGVDHRVAVWLIQAFPLIPHLVIVPANWSRVVRWWERYDDDPLCETRIVVRDMAPGTSYADRNQAIVDASQMLVGFPYEPEEIATRSGSWQTIQMARKADLSIHVYPFLTKEN